MTKIVDFVRGFFATFDDNETQAVSTIKDPVKHRGAVNEDVVESNLFGLSGNTRRVDGTGELDERSYLMFRLAANKQGGAAYIACAPSKGEPCDEVFYIDNGAAIFRVPAFYELPDGTRIPMFGGGGAVAGTIALRSRANGKLVCAENAGSQPLIANRDHPGPWEQFEVLPIE